MHALDLPCHQTRRTSSCQPAPRTSKAFSERSAPHSRRHDKNRPGWSSLEGVQKLPRATLTGALPGVLHARTQRAPGGGNRLVKGRGRTRALILEYTLALLILEVAMGRASPSALVTYWAASFVVSMPSRPLLNLTLNSHSLSLTN